VSLYNPRLRRVSERSAQSQHYVEVLVKLKIKSVERHEGTRIHVKEHSDSVQKLTRKSVGARRAQGVI
jgi:hypothetical protein